MDGPWQFGKSSWTVALARSGPQTRAIVPTETCAASPGHLTVGSFDDSATRRLELSALYLAVDAAALRALGRPSRFARTRHAARTIDELLQARERVLAIALLCSIPLRLDDHDAVGGDPLISPGEKPLLDPLGERRCADV